MSKFSETGVIIRERQTIALGGLADDAAIKLSALVMEEDFRMLKSEIMCVINNLTTLEGQGLYLGIANNELTVAEIAAAIVTGGPLNRNDRGTVETAMRNVKLFAALAAQAFATQVERQMVNESGGPLITIKHRWTYSDPEGWCWFVFNGTGAALTTGASVELTATSFGVWVT